MWLSLHQQDWREIEEQSWLNKQIIEATEGRVLCAEYVRIENMTGTYERQTIYYEDTTHAGFMRLVEYVKEVSFDGVDFDSWDSWDMQPESYRIPRSAHQMSPAGHSNTAYPRIIWNGKWRDKNVDGETFICVNTSTDNTRVLPLWVKLTDCIKA